VGRFYAIHWNAISAVDGRTQAEFRSEPPTKELQDFASWVHGLMRDLRFSALDHSELQEEVPFLDPGDSIVKDGRVRVFNCLFSEI
jgi:hypothetical protein